MKYRIVFFTFCLVNSFFSQVAFNTNCAASQFISSSLNPNSVVSFSDQLECRSNISSNYPVPNVKLYYVYRASLNLSNSSVLDIQVTEINSSLNQNFDYNVYGPFSTQDEGCLEVQNSSSILVSSNQSNGSCSHELITGKYYILEVIILSCSGTASVNVTSEGLDDSYSDVSCLNCIPTFYPNAGNYVFSAWVKDVNANLNDFRYSAPSITLTSGSNLYTLQSSGQIIEGWQRIESIVTLVDSYAGITNLNLNCSNGGDCYFDDIRLFPLDGSMISYVYDPITLRLVAELDERNYAKIYEYDEQGKLIRVKKETEKGIMTIQETRENNAGHE